MAAAGAGRDNADGNSVPRGGGHGDAPVVVNGDAKGGFETPELPVVFVLGEDRRMFLPQSIAVYKCQNCCYCCYCFFAALVVVVIVALVVVVVVIVALAFLLLLIFFCCCCV